MFPGLYLINLVEYKQDVESDCSPLIISGSRRNQITTEWKWICFREKPEIGWRFTQSFISRVKVKFCLTASTAAALTLVVGDLSVGQQFTEMLTKNIKQQCREKWICTDCEQQKAGDQLWCHKLLRRKRFSYLAESVGYTSMLGAVVLSLQPPQLYKTPGSSTSYIITMPSPRGGGKLPLWMNRGEVG